MDEKAKGVLAYIFGWIGGLIILLAFKDNSRNTKFHAAQSIVISVVSWGLTIVGKIILFISFFNFADAIISLIFGALSIVCFVFIIMGIVKVAKSEPDPELPIVGSITRSLFSSMIEG